MKRLFSHALRADIEVTVKSELDEHGVLNIPAIARAVSSRNERENVALEDIEHALLLQGQSMSAAMEFDGVSTDHAVVEIILPSLMH
ncbi:hypothetical protein [Arvimicrobium flavum]|uniref:hypothetical protein n=1 Tax=Arvimicrobium flavum TaxID=3393320 RepID=UPI00237ABAFA|nr:hypothetical protein [Mesorhizobium shangrilense]